MRGRVPIVVLAVLLAMVLATAGVFFIASGPDSGNVPAISDAGDSPAPPDSGGPVKETGAGQEAGLQTPSVETPPPAKRDPKLQSSIADLQAAQTENGPQAAADYAATHGLVLEDGRVEVVLESANLQAATATVTSTGGEIETTYKNLIQAMVPVERLTELSDKAAVNYIREPQRPVTFAVSEGVADIGASTWHTNGHDGAGAKVAIVDPGFSGYQDKVAAGELPANVIVQSFSGDITGGGVVHGTACAEIAYDVAPGAQLYLVNFNTDVELGNAIDYLISQGVDAVSASWGFYAYFQGNGEGIIDDMVQTANAGGIFWANAAGNAAQTHWSGTYTDTNLNDWHEFAPGDEGNGVVLQAGDSIDVYLTWDKWPTTDQDYDLYLIWQGDIFNAAAYSTGVQNGLQPPAEMLEYVVPPGEGGTYWIAINKYDAAGDANFQLYSYPDSLQYQVASGSLGGQPADSPYAATVGAVPFGETWIESFSSQGPTLDGRTKPDLVAPDRVTTSTYGLQGFWGTSASTPHAAGAAALVVDVFPTYSPAQIQAFLEGAATDLGAVGKDNIFGSGKLHLDVTPPTITQVKPTGVIDDSSAVVEVYYSDTENGIDTAAVDVTLDGVSLEGCTVTADMASCSASNLLAGDHNIGGTVADQVGNESTIVGSFSTTCGQPQINQSSPTPFWATYADYVARDLSVDWNFCDTGMNGAVNVDVVGSVNTNSVVITSPLPFLLGDIPPEGGCAPVTFRYRVPNGISAFRSTTYLTAEDSCGESFAYPAPYLAP